MIEAIKVQFAQKTTAYTVVLLSFCATDVLMDVMNKSKLDRFLEHDSPANHSSLVLSVFLTLSLPLFLFACLIKLAVSSSLFACSVQ